MSQILTMADNVRKRGALLALFTIAYFFLFAKVLWRIGDEGTLIYGAQLVAQGALPYRNFFEVMGPASFYWLGLFFKLFGTNILVVRGVLLGTALATTILLYWMTRRIYQGPLDILPALFYLIISFPLWPGTNHHWDSNLFGLLAVGTFFLWQDHDHWGFLALSGIFAGLTSCFMQQKGLFLVTALAVVVLINSYRAGETKLRVVYHLGLLLSGYAIVGGLLVFFFFLSGGLPDLFYANLIWPLTRYHNVNHVPYGYGLGALYYEHYREILQSLGSAPVSRVMALLFIMPLLIVFGLPLILMVLGGLSLLKKVRRANILNAPMLTYWLAGSAFLIAEIHRKDIMHLIYGSPLLLIILFVICSYLFANKSFYKLIITLITSCMILFGGYNAFIAANANQEIVTRRGILYGFKKDSALKFLIEHTKPGDYAFIYPYYPMYYFLADIKNPTRYSILLYHINTEAQFSEVIDNLEANKVKYVLWDTLVSGINIKIWFPQYEHPANENLHLEQYLEDNYDIIGIENGFRILCRREE